MEINRSRVGSASAVLVLAIGLLGGASPVFGEANPPLGPEVSVKYATGFSVARHDGYTEVVVKNPWRGAERAFRYLLVRHRAQLPVDPGDAQVVRVPVRRLISLSTTTLGHLEALNAVDRLIGVSNARHVNTSSVLARIGSGDAVEVGGDADLNLEMVLNAEPDLVLAYGTGRPEYDVHPKLIQAGIPVALSSGYMEQTPLGRCEWIKFVALFLDEEERAERVFAEVAGRYEALAEKARAECPRPTVLVGSNRGGTWFVPGGKSYVATLVADAGARYLWADDGTAGSLPLDFEVVLEKAQDASFWLNPGDWDGADRVVRADARYAAFEALQNGRVYSNNARLNTYGGNDYWETGSAKPHLVLADLVRIFHPRLAPKHTLIWYRRLNSRKE